MIGIIILKVYNPSVIKEKAAEIKAFMAKKKRVISGHKATTFNYFPGSARKSNKPSHKHTMTSSLDTQYTNI